MKESTHNGKARATSDKFVSNKLNFQGFERVKVVFFYLDREVKFSKRWANVGFVEFHKVRKLLGGGIFQYINRTMLNSLSSPTLSTSLYIVRPLGPTGSFSVTN